MNLPKSVLYFCMLAALILFCQRSYTQTNFVSGYILTSEGDSLRGYIDYRNWLRNPKHVVFKLDLDAHAMTYTPSSIRGFGMAAEHYIAATVEIETSPISLQRLRESSDFDIQIDSVFLVLLSAGQKSLYYLKTSSYQDQFYIQGEKGNYQLLYYKKYLSEGRKNVLERNVYRDQLKAYLKECPTIHSVIDRARYSLGDLQRIFGQYSACKGEKVSFQNQQFLTKSHYGFIGGLSHNNLHISGDRPTHLVAADFKSALGFSIGGFFDLKLSRHFNKWSFYNDLTFKTSKITGFYQTYTNENNYSNYSTTFKLNYLKLTTLVRYQYTFKESLSLFFNGGITNGLMVGPRLETVVFRKMYSSETTMVRPAFEGYRKYEQAIVGGTGVAFGKWGVELRAERGNGLSNTQGIKTSSTRYFGLMSYRL